MVDLFFVWAVFRKTTYTFQLGNDGKSFKSSVPWAESAVRHTNLNNSACQKVGDLEHFWA
jgi:hypothetical protein